MLRFCSIHDPIGVLIELLFESIGKKWIENGKKKSHYQIEHQQSIDMRRVIIQFELLLF